MTNPIIEYYPNGNKESESYHDEHGELYRDPLGGPAFISYYSDGYKRIERYRSNGQYHRDPEIGPAVIWYYNNGKIELEQYRVNGLLHRDPLEGPSSIWYDEDGKTKRIEHWVNGEFHNPYGPAYINYFLYVFEWFFNDKKYTNEVNEYLDKHDLKCQDMTQTDFDIMWTILL